MNNVLIGKTWCPKFDEIKLKPCPRPPCKQVLLEKVMAAAHDKGIRSIGVEKDHAPDKRWLIDVLAYINPLDEIFKKSYLPPPKKSKLS